MAMIKEIAWFLFIMAIGAGLMYHLGPEQTNIIYIVHEFKGCFAT